MAVVSYHRKDFLFELLEHPRGAPESLGMDFANLVLCRLCKCGQIQHVLLILPATNFYQAAIGASVSPNFSMLFSQVPCQELCCLVD
jgi:hypothetical protein